MAWGRGAAASGRCGEVVTVGRAGEDSQGRDGFRSALQWVVWTIGGAGSTQPVPEDAVTRGSQKHLLESPNGLYGVRPLGPPASSPARVWARCKARCAPFQGWRAVTSLGPVAGRQHPQGKDLLHVSSAPAAARPCCAPLCAWAPLGRVWLRPLSTLPRAVCRVKASWVFSCPNPALRGCPGVLQAFSVALPALPRCREAWQTGDGSPGSVPLSTPLGDAGGEGGERCDAEPKHRQRFPGQARGWERWPSSRAPAGVDRMLGKISVLEERSGVGPGCPGQWGSPRPWRGSKTVWMWHLGTGFSRRGGVGVTVGLDDLRGCFQP